MEKAQSTSRFGWQHFAVAGLGLVTLLLLVFAGKSALHNEDPEPKDKKGSAANAKSNEEPNQDVSLFGLIPAIASEGRVGQLLDSLKSLGPESSGREALMKSLVGELRDAGRLDAASLYADKVAEMNPSLQNLIVAGALLRNASLVPPLSEDSSSASKWCDRAIVNLEKAISIDSTSEDALLELGLAMVQNPAGGKSMLGIQHLVKVTEINPKNEEAFFQLGLMSMRVGKWEKAVERFKKVTKKHPQYLLAQFYLAESLEKVGKKAESAKILKELASQKENSEIARRSSEKLNNL